MRRRHVVVGSALALAAGGVLVAAATTRRRPVAAPTGEVCIVAPTLPYDPRSGQSLLAARPVPADARCPVCGMFPARHPRWAAMAIFDDGAAQFFDTPAHLMLYLEGLPRYQPGRSNASIGAMYVADHAGGGWLPLAQAVFVTGSQARGPMRTEDLPAFGDAAAAQRFIARAGGAAVDAARLRAEGLPTPLRALAPHRH